MSFITETQILWVGIATVGGVVRYVDVYLKTSVPPRLGPAMGNAFVSGFSGFMVALTVTRFDPSWALIAAGAGGYLGTQGLDWISTVIQQRFGGQPIPPPPTPSAPVQHHTPHTSDEPEDTKPSPNGDGR